jgi:hypothetical protein
MSPPIYKDTGDMLQAAEISYTADVGGIAVADERRSAERVRFPLEVRWEALSGMRAARVYDISLSGCYIETLGDVQTGEIMRLEIQSPTGRWLQFEGQVVHHQRNMGFGLRLVNLSDARRDALARLLEYARGGPSF